ncbi:hypothetical protein OQA88_5718 [Cercophora sp. LCS_1]
MCQFVHFTDQTCKHKWAKITLSCYPGWGFSTCPLFFDRHSTGPMPRTVIACQEPCPVCDLNGVYDGNMVRVIKREVIGVKIGKGRAKADAGWEVRCCVM